MKPEVIVTENNIDDVLEALSESYLKGMERIGLAAEKYAKALCPVDTGRLRNSITHFVVIDEGEPAAYIGTDVEYGPYVELGTSRQKAQPFLRPAAWNHGAEYRQILESELRGH